VLAAVGHNTWFDQVSRVISIVGASIPVFVFGLIFLMIFYAELQWFPPGRLSPEFRVAISSPDFRSITYLVTIDSLINGRFDIFLDAVRHLIMPAITLAYFSMAIIMRVTRSSMLETLRQEYITTANSKGLAWRTVIRRHAMPNALIPVVTVSGFQVIALLAGAVITETVYNYPGIGKAAAEAAVQLDVVTVLGFALLTGTILIGTNLLVDILYAVIDPRVRLQ